MAKTINDLYNVLEVSLQKDSKIDDLVDLHPDLRDSSFLNITRALQIIGKLDIFLGDILEKVSDEQGNSVINLVSDNKGLGVFKSVDNLASKVNTISGDLTQAKLSLDKLLKIFPIPPDPAAMKNPYPDLEYAHKHWR
jgi:hypothetical protein